MHASDLLFCAVCRGQLEGKDSAADVVRCSICGRTYRHCHGFYDMTPLPVPDADVQETWAMWEQLQANAEVVYDRDPEQNLSVGRRRDADQFAKFSRLQGVVLDVGCGPQAAPSYGLDFDGRLIGLDPLAGTQPREFEFVQGIGEYLPFADGTFDRVLFATSLDHMLVPTRTLAEARRVVKPDGFVSIWFGHHDHADGSQLRRRAQLLMTMVRRRDLSGLVRRGVAKVNASRRRVDPEHLASMPIPEGAEDHFHAYHLTEDLVEQWIVASGLRTVDMVNDHEAGSLVLAAPLPN